MGIIFSLFITVFGILFRPFFTLLYLDTLRLTDSEELVHPARFFTGVVLVYFGAFASIIRASYALRGPPNVFLYGPNEERGKLERRAAQLLYHLRILVVVLGGVACILAWDCADVTTNPDDANYKLRTVFFVLTELVCAFVFMFFLGDVWRIPQLRAMAAFVALTSAWSLAYVVIGVRSDDGHSYVHATAQGKAAFILAWLSVIFCVRHYHVTSAALLIPETVVVRPARVPPPVEATPLGAGQVGHIANWR